MDYGSHTSDLIQRRKDLKQKADATDAYRSLSKEVQKLCRKDKEKYIANIYKEIEDHGNTNEPRDLFNKMKLATIEFKSQNGSVLNNEENLKTDIEEIVKTWRIYYADQCRNEQTPQENL